LFVGRRRRLGESLSATEIRKGARMTLRPVRAASLRQRCCGREASRGRRRAPAPESAALGRRSERRPCTQSEQSTTADRSAPTLSRPGAPARRTLAEASEREAVPASVHRRRSQGTAPLAAEVIMVAADGSAAKGGRGHHP
jgi:hypothetical protein